MLKICPTVIKLCQIEGESELPTQKILATTSRFLAWKPNANTGVDRGETSVGIAFGGSAE